jgi:hypothetical protein
MKLIVTIPALLIGSIALAQPALKLYAFSQVTTPGMVPGRDAEDENGKAIPQPRGSVNYLVYLASSSKTIQPKEIWIKDRWYAVLRYSVVRTPVYSEPPVKKLLVPSQKWRVIQLQIGDPLPKKSKSDPSTSSGQGIVLFYSWNKHIYSTSLKKITPLPPIHGL